MDYTENKPNVKSICEKFQFIVLGFWLCLSFVSTAILRSHVFYPIFNMMTR